VDLAHECRLVGEVLPLSQDRLLDLVEVLQEIELDLVLERDRSSRTASRRQASAFGRSTEKAGSSMTPTIERSAASICSSVIGCRSTSVPRGTRSSWT